MKHINSYETIIFDCDGVIFNSNFFKMKRFISIAETFGSDAVDTMKEVLLKNAGESRYLLFENFINKLPKQLKKGCEIDQLLEVFSKNCRVDYINATRSKNISKLINLTDADAMIVSSSDMLELNNVFDDLNLRTLFVGGIYGSPETKYHIINRGIFEGKIKSKVLYFGDGKIDIEMCEKFGFDLIFVTDWTAMEGYENTCLQKGIQTVPNLDNYYAAQMSLK